MSAVISVTTSTMDAPEQVGTYWGTTYAFIMMDALVLLGILLSMRIQKKTE